MMLLNASFSNEKMWTGVGGAIKSGNICKEKKYVGGGNYRIRSTISQG